MSIARFLAPVIWAARHAHFCYEKPMSRGRACFVLAVLSVSDPAWAQTGDATGGVHLSWVRAEGASACLSQHALERAVATRLGRDPFQGATRQWVEGVIAVDGGVFTAQLFERDVKGEVVGSRVLQEATDDCRDLDLAVSLAVALIIDPEGAREEPSPAPPAEASSGSATARYPDEPPPSPSERPPPTPKRGTSPTPLPVQPSPPDRRPPGVVVGPLLSSGLLPKPAVGLEMVTEVSVARTLAVRSGVRYLPEVRSAGSLADVSYGLTAFHGGPCMVGRGPIAPIACVSLEVGALHAVVHDPVPLEAGDRLWAAAVAQAGLRVEISGSFWLDSHLIAVVPFVHREYRVRSEGEWTGIHEVPWVAPLAALGLGIYLQ